MGVDDEVGDGVVRGTRTNESEGSPIMDHVVTTSPPRAPRWRRIGHRATTRVGAFGALASLAIGACGPGAQCAPGQAPGPETTASTPPPDVDILLAAKPVQAPCTYRDTFGAARGGGRVHLGTDIMAAEGQEVYAVQSGEITKLYSQATDALAGNGIRLGQPDGTFYFYGHMSALAPGIAVGTEVTAGQLVGWVGHTGNAGVDHLHLEIHPGGGTAVNSYPIIVASGGAC